MSRRAHVGQPRTLDLSCESSEKLAGSLHTHTFFLPEGNNEGPRVRIELDSIVRVAHPAWMSGQTGDESEVRCWHTYCHLALINSLSGLQRDLVYDESAWTIRVVRGRLTFVFAFIGSYKSVVAHHGEDR